MEAIANGQVSAIRPSPKIGAEAFTNVKRYLLHFCFFCLKIGL